jgi:phenylacetate-CoA ligase
MKLGEYLRNRAFKTIDALRNKPIQKYINELYDFEITGFEYTTVQKKLKELLTLAQSASPYYENKNGDFELSTYPVIAKSFLINNANDIRSMRHTQEKLIRVSTSGSYGTPFSFYLTPEKKKRQKAEVIYYGLEAGYEVGVSHAYFRTTLSKSRFKLLLQNETFICSKILGNDFLIDARALLKKKKLKILIGFPSAIAMLAQFCIDSGDKPTDFVVKGVLTFAENLTAKQRNCISKVFGCKVYSRYGTEELGVLGCQSDNESDFILNTCNYVVEILKLHENVSVSPGEMGRVVVTDLHSDAFPLIRYETGDLAVLGDVFEENKGWAKSLKMLSGRVMQMLNATNGEKLYPLYFENIIEKTDFFVQYQLIQRTKKEFTLKLVPRATFDTSEFSEIVLINELREWLGDDALIELQMVDDIEMLPSGKRPSVINNLAMYQIHK